MGRKTLVIMAVFVMVSLGITKSPPAVDASRGLSASILLKSDGLDVPRALVDPNASQRASDDPYCRRDGDFCGPGAWHDCCSDCHCTGFAYSHCVCP
uniref:Uncharacterized protein n=1 Tax=Epipremnum aureum TaxID=78380 RepID=D2KZ18_9ARAE|nr:hypothetical protein [Epipremnum aureum]